MIRYQFLPGDPKDGRIPLEFSEDNQPIPPPGQFVSFHPKGSKSWLGHFQMGSGTLDTVVDHPDGKNVVVVVHGMAYVLDPETRLLDLVLGDGFESIIPVPHLKALVISNGMGFDAVHENNQLWWSSPRISWYGFRGLMVAGDFLVGEAHSSVSDRWYRFKLDLKTGECKDGIYEREAGQFAKIMPEGPPAGGAKA